MEDCAAAAADPDRWAVVHACKNPCHAGKCGQRPDPDGPDYFARQEGHNLYLNIIDPEAPLFNRRVFDAFLKFARAEWQEGRRLLIHCNKGESRAPTLALLFLSRVLYRISSETFDDAWDGFQQLLGEEVYRPSRGIETWMREHWSEFGNGPRLGSMPIAGERAAPLAAPIVPKLEGDIAPSMVLANPLIHFAGFTEIEGKSHTWFKPVPNRLQFDIAEAYQYCVANNLPCRLIILKPRQVGCSTFCAEVCYHHMRRFKSDMIVMGDVAKRTEKVWSLFQDIPKHDSFAWDSKIPVANTEKTRFAYRDGSEGLVEHDTALDPKAGISGTRQVVWLTEAARYMKTSGRDKKVITAVLNSLPQLPNTLGLAESTAEGASGWFYENWQKAVTLEERKAGAIGNGWIKIFAPWFAFTEHSLERSAEYADYFTDELDVRERRGVELYGWNAAQIAWRRMKIANDCASDPRMFDQDFPEDAESCFLASGRPRFDMEALVPLEKAARVTHGLARKGVLERGPDGGVNFRAAGESEAWLWVAEEPTYGLAYEGFIDPCQGEQSEGSLFPDAHACGILRRGYQDERKVIHKTRLAAAIDVPTGCRWDDNIIAERAKMLMDWYGGCEIVPEIGNGLGVLNELRRAGCLIYQREKMDNLRPGVRLQVLGWETNRETRPIVVNAIGDAIRKRELDCSYQPAIGEMKTFVINDRGRAEAKSGCHDDWVLGIGIGLQCIERATVMQPPALFSHHREGDVENALPTSGLSAAAFS